MVVPPPYTDSMAFPSVSSGPPKAVQAETAGLQLVSGPSLVNFRVPQTRETTPPAAVRFYATTVFLSLRFSLSEAFPSLGGPVEHPFHTDPIAKTRERLFLF